MPKKKEFNWRPWLAIIISIFLILTGISGLLNSCEDDRRQREENKAAENDVPYTPRMEVIHYDLNSKLNSDANLNQVSNESQSDTAKETIQITEDFPTPPEQNKATSKQTEPKPITAPDKKITNVRKFFWNFDGHNCSITLTVNPKLNEKYQNTKSYKNDDDFNNYLVTLPGDKTIDTIATKLIELTIKYPGTDLAELTMSFIQSIPFDNAKDAESKKTKKLDYLTPYQVLYQNQATCLEKSLLAIALLRYFGYGNALFLYKYAPDENSSHAAVGIQCSRDDALRSTDYYCYAGTSGNYKIGVIPYKEYKNPLIKLQTKGRTYGGYRKNNPNA